MNIIKKLKIRLSVALFALVAVALVGVALTAKSWSGEAPKVVVEGNYIEAEQPLPPQDEILGSVASPYMQQERCFGDECIVTVAMDFIDASTTIMAVPNPFRAPTTTAGQVVLEDLGRYGLMGPTTTIDLVRLNVTGAATTTYSVMCSAAPNKYVTSSASYQIIETGVTVSSTPIIENNMTAALSNGGEASGTVAKIMLSPELPWLICKVNPAAAGAFTETTNTFAGKGIVRFNRTK